LLRSSCPWIEVNGRGTRVKGRPLEEECGAPRRKGSMRGHEGPVLEIPCSLLERRAPMLDGEGSLLEVDVRLRPLEARAARISCRPLHPFYP
jgi:hypothetical protein